MKTLTKLIFAAVLAIICLAIPQSKADDVFSGKGTGATTLSYYIPSMRFIGSPAVTFVNTTSDKASSVLKFYDGGAPVTVTVATNSAQVTVYCVPVGITNSDVVVVRNVSADTYQRLVVSSATATSLTFTANISNASVVGDTIHKMTAAGTFAVAAATVEKIASGGVWHGVRGRPLLVEVDGTSACAINAISGVYVK